MSGAQDVLSPTRLDAMHRHGRAPFPLRAELPDSLRGVLLDFHWDLDRLHGLDLPVREMATTELGWHLELPFWAVDGRPFRVSPAAVAADPDRHPEQWHRTMAADLRHPLDGYRGPDGRVTVLDGVHRLLKATVTNQPAVRIRLLTDDDFDAIAVPGG